MDEQCPMAASQISGLDTGCFAKSNWQLATSRIPVIDDIILEKANGFDVIRTMRDRVPHLPVVAMSGMTAPEFVTASSDAGSVICLQKPFRPGELLRAIEAARKIAAAVAV